MNVRIIEFQKRETKKPGIYTDWVHYASVDALDPTGNYTASTWERVKLLKPLEDYDPSGEKSIYLRNMWSVIGPAYDAWKMGYEIVEDGTPLMAWPDMNADKVKALNIVGIKSVEALAEAGSNILSKVNLPDTAAMKQSAQTWLKSRDAARLQGEIDDLKRQNEEMMAMLVAQVQEAASPAEEKRGPGRPRKEVAA